MTAPTDAEIEDARKILFEVYGLERFRDTRYLDWFYRKNPVAPAVVINRHTDGECVGHTVGIPMRFRRGKEVMRFIFPMNIAVGEKARGQGLMTEMTAATFQTALERDGDGAVIGMPNAGSTRGYLTRLGCHLVTPLPVHVMAPLWPGRSRVESHDVDESFLESNELERLAGDVENAGTPHSWSQIWDLPVLRWRLSNPSARYAVHASPDVFLVTTTTVEKGVRFTVVLKTLARRAKRGVLANDVVAAACRFHRSPVAIHAGFSHAARFVGAPLPERLKPSPLNLVFRTLRPGYMDEPSFRYSTVEFLDFDAY